MQHMIAMGNARITIGPIAESSISLSIRSRCLLRRCFAVGLMSLSLVVVLLSVFLIADWVDGNLSLSIAIFAVLELGVSHNRSRD